MLEFSYEKLIFVFILIYLSSTQPYLLDFMNNWNVQQLIIWAKIFYEAVILLLWLLCHISSALKSLSKWWSLAGSQIFRGRLIIP